MIQEYADESTNVLEIGAGMGENTEFLILKTTFIKAFGNIRTTKPTDTFLTISKRLKNPIL
jgi:hypothetical protein